MNTEDDKRTAGRYHVTICGLGQDCDTRQAVAEVLDRDQGWKEEGEYAIILDRQTGQEFTV